MSTFVTTTKHCLWHQRVTGWATKHILNDLQGLDVYLFEFGPYQNFPKGNCMQFYYNMLFYNLHDFVLKLALVTPNWSLNTPQTYGGHVFTRPPFPWQYTLPSSLGLNHLVGKLGLFGVKWMGMHAVIPSNSIGTSYLLEGRFCSHMDFRLSEDCPRSGSWSKSEFLLFLHLLTF